MPYSKYLELFLDRTPLAIERLKEAWAGLSCSDKITLLNILLPDSTVKNRSDLLPHHREKVIKLALSDINPYIRYLAAKNIRLPFFNKFPDKELYEKVQMDSSLLVRCAMKEGLLNSLSEDPDTFWKRPHVERLIIVTGVEERGEIIAALLRYASKELLPNNAISLEEILDLLLQYMGWKTIADRVAYLEEHDYFEFSRNTDESIEALWEVIPDIPPTLSYVLIDTLPEIVKYRSVIPPKITESLNEDQLIRLLCRNDIALMELRRKIYLESPNREIREAAVSNYGFTLSDLEILNMVYDPTKQGELEKNKIDELLLLAGNWRGGTLVQYEALLYLLENIPKCYNIAVSSWDCDRTEIYQAHRAKLLSGELKSGILEMRLFELAKQISPIDLDTIANEIPAELNKYKDLVVIHNPWQTYLNLKSVLQSDSMIKAENILPGVYIRNCDFRRIADKIV